MPTLVREKDWSATPLGPPERWSASLKLFLDLILGSGFPMAIRWGPELVMLYNDAYRIILGDKHPDALGRPLGEVWPEIMDELGPLTRSILSGARGAFFAEDLAWTIRRHGGKSEEAFFTASYSPIPDDAAPGGIGGVLVTCVETTERVRAERALRGRNTSLEAAVTQRTLERDRIWQVSEDLLGVSTFEGYFLSVNPAWTTLLGWSEEEIKRLRVSELRHPEDALAATAGRARLQRGVPTVRMENRFRHKDGSWRWIYWTMTAENGLIYVIGRHVTGQREAQEKLRRAQEQLAQSQKIDALGKLTGGIAHDFNNLLTIVRGHADTLRNRSRDERALRSLDAIELAATRGERLTRQLLAFSRNQILNPTVLDLGERLDAIREVLASSARGDINLAIDIPEGVWPIAADVGELELALVNLVVNARDAMPRGGAIAVTAENVVLAADDTLDRCAGEFVALRVKDTGTGIPAAVLPRIFEPFFTTKDADKGTGLGLSQVYGFSRQSGGTTTVASAPGAGTTVTVYLPRRAAGAAPQENDERLIAALSGEESVLLVEDNDDVREVAETMLCQLGYRVACAASAAEAIEALGNGAEVDLVFTDIVMPGATDGVGLAHYLSLKYPHVALLLTSGYARHADMIDKDFPVLRKPYRLADLAQSVRDALGRKREALYTAESLRDPRRSARQG
jgi:PAS domain S-box-containing protein